MIILVFMLLSVVDGVLTYVGVKGGFIVEGNPLMRGLVGGAGVDRA